MDELEVTIKFKYTPEPQNYDHLPNSTDIDSIIECDTALYIEDPYLITEHFDKAEITIKKVE